MGGTCDTPVSASTKDEMMGKGMEHLKEMHPEMHVSVASTPKDDPKMLDWQKKFDATWEAAPEA